MRSHRPNHRADPVERLVRLIAGERSTDSLLSRVAADEQMIRNARLVYRERITAEWSKEQSLVELCKSHNISIEYFDEQLRTIVFAFNLVDREHGLYEILEVGGNATKAEIKRAFRRLSLTWHPDMNPQQSSTASERFRLIHHAYNVLSNEALRREYDRSMLIPACVEVTEQDEEKPSVRGRWRRVFFYQAAMVAAILITLSFLVDYQKFLSNRYYKIDRAYVGKQELYSKRDMNHHGQGDALESSKVPPAADRKQAGTEEPSLPPPDQTVEVESRPRQDAKTDAPAIVTPRDVPSPPLQPSDSLQASPAARPTERLEEDVRQAALDVPSPKPVLHQAALDATTPKPARPQPPAQAPSVPSPSKQPALRQAAEPVEKPSPGVKTASAAVLSTEVTSRQISDFLALYTHLYERKDLTAFLRLFEQNAYENNVPLRSLVATYTDSFRRARDIHYQIRLNHWSPVEGGIFLNGSFQLDVEFQDRNPVATTGSIDMKLIRSGGDFRIHYVNYRYNRREASR